MNSNLDLYIAVTPEHHERFGLKPLRKKLQKQLSDEHPTFDVRVSTDKKSLCYSKNSKEKLRKKVSKDEINKQLKFIGKKWSLTLNAFKRKGRIAMSSKDKNLTPVQQEYKKFEQEREPKRPVLKIV